MRRRKYSVSKSTLFGTDCPILHESLPHTKVADVMEIKGIDGIAFQKATKKWRKLEKGDFVIGTINYMGSVELTISN